MHNRDRRDDGDAGSGCALAFVVLCLVALIIMGSKLATAWIDGGL